jgi:hypothetical protein
MKFRTQRVIKNGIYERFDIFRFIINRNTNDNPPLTKFNACPVARPLKLIISGKFTVVKQKGQYYGEVMHQENRKQQFEIKNKIMDDAKLPNRHHFSFLIAHLKYGRILLRKTALSAPICFAALRKFRFNRLRG